MTDSSNREQRFVAYVQGLIEREDRAALAALRRALGKTPGEAVEAHRYVLPWLAPDIGARREEAFYLVGALFAWHQQNWPTAEGGPGRSGLGASLRWLAQKRESASIERRFVALLNSHSDELGRHLRRIVGLLRAEDIRVDWAQLLRDVQHWDHESRYVQRTWARAYWGGRADAVAAPDSATDPDAAPDEPTRATASAE